MYYLNKGLPCDVHTSSLCPSGQLLCRHMDYFRQSGKFSVAYMKQGGEKVSGNSKRRELLFAL